MANDGDTNEDINPQSEAIVLHRRISGYALGQCYPLEACNLAALVARRYPMEFVTVRDHAGLSRSGCSDAIASQCGRRWLYRCRRPGNVTDDGDADFHFGPHARAVAVHGRIPLRKLGKSDLVRADDLAASIAFWQPSGTGCSCQPCRAG